MTKTELLQLQNEHRERNYEDEYYNTPAVEFEEKDKCIIVHRTEVILLDCADVKVSLKGVDLCFEVNTKDPDNTEEFYCRLNEMRTLIETISRNGMYVRTRDMRWSLHVSAKDRVLTLHNEKYNRSIDIGFWTIDSLLTQSKKLFTLE